jgi:hypothetical protein
MSQGHRSDLKGVVRENLDQLSENGDAMLNGCQAEFSPVGVERVGSRLGSSCEKEEEGGVTLYTDV